MSPEEVRGAGETKLGQLAGRLLRSPVGRTLGPFIMAVGALAGSTRVDLGLIAMGALLVVGSDVATQRRVNQLEALSRQAREDGVVEVLNLGVEMLEHALQEAGGLFRAAVYQVDRGSDQLRVITSTLSFRQDDRAIAWKRGEGPPGEAWQLGRPVIAADEHGDTRLVMRTVHRMPLLDVQPDQLQLSAEQRVMLSRVKMMLAYPIADPRNPREILAVVTLDDRLPPGDHLEAVLRAAQHLRDQVQRRLFTNNYR